MDMEEKMNRSHKRSRAEIDRPEPAQYCCICLDEEKITIGVDTCWLQCNHIFHTQCLLSWTIRHPDNTCPVCRGDVRCQHTFHRCTTQNEAVATLHHENDILRRLLQEERDGNMAMRVMTGLAESGDGDILFRFML